jgi:hypothetical protein
MTRLSSLDLDHLRMCYLNCISLVAFNDTSWMAWKRYGHMWALTVIKYLSQNWSVAVLENTTKICGNRWFLNRDLDQKFPKYKPRA